MADEYYSGAYTGAEIDAAIAAANAAAPQATTYTKEEVDTALAAKANAADLGTAAAANATTSITSGGTDLPTSGTVYTDQQRQDIEISSLVDRGAKNLSPVNDVIFTRPTGAAYTKPISINLAPGEYVVRYKLTTTANAAVAITYDGSEHTIYDSNSPYSDTIITHNFTVVNSGTSFRFYFNQAAEVSELMICTAADYEASSTFKTYALDNPTLTAGIYSIAHANGRKNLIPRFSTIENGGCIYTYNDGSITVTGNKSGALSIAEVISNEDLSKYGLSAGDNIVVVTDNANVGLTVIFVDSQGTQDPAISIYNETRTVTIPDGRTKWYVRIQVKPTTTGTINETAKLMICDKKLYDIDPTFQPYAPTNHELYEMILAMQAGT